MDLDTIAFFGAEAQALGLYELLEALVLEQIPGTQIRVQKTQISFYRRRLYGCASRLRIRKKKDLPPGYLVVTFGLGRAVDDPRIEASVEPYPGRWTHHVLLWRREQVDQELLGWLREATDFAAAK